jgi:hypothetical protein
MGGPLPVWAGPPARRAYGSERLGRMEGQIQRHLHRLGAEDQKRQPAFCRQQHPLPYFTLGFRQVPGLQNSGFKCPKNL